MTMSKINPTELTRSDILVVSDEDSPYYGTKGLPNKIYDDRIEIKMHVGGGEGMKLVKTFDLDQLAHAE